MDEPNNEKAQHDPLPGCFLRLFWMLVGHVLLAFLPPSRLSADDPAFLAWKTQSTGHSLPAFWRLDLWIFSISKVVLLTVIRLRSRVGEATPCASAWLTQACGLSRTRSA